MLARLHELELLAAIYQDLTWDNWLAEKIGLIHLQSPGIEWEIAQEIKGMSVNLRLAYALWLLRLNGQQARRATNRLKMPRAVAEEILAARRLWQEISLLREVEPSKVVSKLSEIPHLAIYVVYLACEDPKIREILLKFVTRWRHVEPTITGHDLRNRGLPPGPAYKEILIALRAAWLDGKIDSAAQEAELLESLLRTQDITEKG
jgi:tRNA nucleotidyltransferase (CCA-adding enzyme)